MLYGQVCWIYSFTEVILSMICFYFGKKNRSQFVSQVALKNWSPVHDRTHDGVPF